ncbi:MAG: carboxymuconolactone decarboxylase family protein [Candidatus Omnitrophica bacterium]|nr:carboxymuconolactone decarboxylase family protein [Candidatus Omnitrophota bacterium]
MLYVKALKEKEGNQQAQEILNNVKAKIGMVPNIYAAMANSPSALKALLNFRETLGKGSLSAKEIEVIALAAAEENECEYCLCAHSAIGKSVGLSEEQIKEIRSNKSKDTKISALSELTREIVKTKGNPAKAKLDLFFKAGYSPEALIDLIAFIALNIYTNYFNHIFETDIDFPKVGKA